MAFTLQLLHRTTGGKGAPDTGFNNVGEIAMNFDVTVGSQPELWANDGTAWSRLNPELDVAMAYIALSGGTTGNMLGIGTAWTAFTPQPTEPFVIAVYGDVPYLMTGNPDLDSGWNYLVDPVVASTAAASADASATAAAASAVSSANYATASGISETNAATYEAAALDSSNAAEGFASLAASLVIPDPSTGTEGQALVANPALDGYEFTSLLKPTTANEWTKTQNFNATTLTDATTVAWDTESNQVTSVTLTANRIMGTPTNLVDGGFYALTVVQGAGGQTLVWNTVFKWPDATAPTLSTGAAARDEFVFRSDGTNLYEIGRSLNIV